MSDQNDFDAFQDDELEFDHPLQGPPGLAYIRIVAKDDIDGLPAHAPDGPYFALHDEEGRPLAVFKDRGMAMLAARSNNLSAVPLH